MIALNWIAVGTGAATGAWLRWRLGMWLNARFPTIPPGTFAANLLAALLVGISTEVLARFTGVPPEIRLLVITGFLGGLSTFSTFSAEVVALLERREIAWAMAAMALHVIGSLTMTVAGIMMVRMALSVEVP